MIEIFNEKANTESELFNIIIDSINQPICIVNKDCEVIYWNKSSENFYYIKKNEILNKDIRLFFPDALLPRVIRHQKSYENVYHSPKKDYYIVISAAPLYNKSGKLIGGISFEKDITEQIKTTKLLEKTTNNLNLLKEEMYHINHGNYYSFSKIIGNNEKFLKVINICKDFSQSNISMLLLGESGTGKEVVSRSIHSESNRKGLFIAINCSAIPENLFESELFGYESGAFTGAQKQGKIGKIEAANNGTLFLDEIADMPIDMQPKFLRVLEDGIITRLGGISDIKLDVRIIAATNKNLKELTLKGKFRQDLYYRLSSVVVHLPSLKERKDDISLLIDYFLENYCTQYGINIPYVPEKIIKVLTDYTWEGNIRELKNVIERIVIMLKKDNSDAIMLDYLPEYILKSNSEIEGRIIYSKSLDLNKTLINVEKDTIIHALKVSEGNIKKATELLNIPRTSLYYKLKKYNITLKNSVECDK